MKNLSLQNKNFNFTKIFGFVYSIIFYPSMIYLFFYAFIPLIKTGKIPSTSRYVLITFLFAIAFFIYELAKYAKLIKKSNFTDSFKKGFNTIPNFITDCINFILLFFVYFIGIGIVSIVSKVMGKHYLDLKGSGSSWIQRKLKKKPIEEYYRSF